MSAKRQLVEAIEAMPETLTLEEVIERLYRAFKLKRQAEQSKGAAFRPQLERLAREGRVVMGAPNSPAAYRVILERSPHGLIERLIDEDRAEA